MVHGARTRIPSPMFYPSHVWMSAPFHSYAFNHLPSVTLNGQIGWRLANSLGNMPLKRRRTETLEVGYFSYNFAAADVSKERIFPGWGSGSSALRGYFLAIRRISVKNVTPSYPYRYYGNKGFPPPRNTPTGPSIPGRGQGFPGPP